MMDGEVELKGFKKVLFIIALIAIFIFVTYCIFFDGGLFVDNYLQNIN